MTDDRRVILVTGASSGIGFAAARDMAARGWRVFATVRSDADAARVGALPGVAVLRLDYADPASVDACADALLAATGGRIDALFNNGAYGQPGAVEDLSTAVLRAQFEVNLFGWHDLTCRLIPAMRARGSGRIVQCSSILGFLALKYRGAYIASKHALEGLTDTLRLELAGTGISVSSIQPGPIATNFVRASMEKFHANVDIEGSPHRAVYERRLERMRRGGANRFKLPPEAVVAALVHACESPRPRPVYRVTTPTKVIAIVERLLPTRLYHRLALAISDGEQ
ncbi:SDR family NAD(P)-dependent oxidoreductase [Oharaeibacter diazotrophicus]|uniref:Short-subunit dehydrogenase n=1 Tax=Oharaeibacter diazotrophicus TaxID=1920512 RepID=A0A4R6REK4_9HYPH|nr:SDR family NAD(P)-dependent oxidoreductase [Oharaeibacter diazotrophicus]TDP84106.1 short-subunit dehydrogenase [Oharaeibacter diazotrophicus]BBE73145.1 levodione reductase [Pleomorphomonas sp. SM30]GLS74934.1 short-chain dehydrogenase/reductase [Oharaeibacter diazotrophicus]